MDFEFSVLVLLACGLVFVVFTRLHIASLTLRAATQRPPHQADASTRAAAVHDIRSRSIAKSTTLPPVAASTRLNLPPQHTPDSTHAA